MRATKHNPGQRSAQRGASLIEVLVAVLVLAIGMLGIAALQAVTLRNTQGAADRTTAVIQAYSMLDMMRANRGQARAGSYNQGFLCDAPEDPGASRIDGDVARWITQMQEAMGPSACGSINCGANECAVSVRWDASRVTGGEEGETQTLVTETRL